MKNLILALLLFCVTSPIVRAGPVRIKDLVEFDGVRSNDLVGYGLVVGLNGTGDGIRNAPFTDYAVQLATFSGVEQQVRTNDLLSALGQKMGLTGLSQIAGWVGMEARVSAPAYFDGVPLTVFAPPAPEADQAFLIVRDSQGSQVDRAAIDTVGGQVQWAGVDASGAPFPPGLYSFSVESSSSGSVLATDPAQVYALVSEARLDNGVATIVLAGGSEVPADEISAIRAPA